tara:strand:+ start:8 stop:664 length:657 start_codon:yes stop_codon:yes gene_type:complete
VNFKDKFFKKSPFTSHGGPHVNPTDNYKKYLESREKQKSEIDSLKNVISSQKEKQNLYDEQMKNYKSMMQKVKDFSYSPEIRQYFNREGDEIDFSKDVAAGKINPYGKSGEHYIDFKDKDKKQIRITFGDYASNDEDLFTTDYYAKPEGKRPEVTSETSNILQKKLKLFQEQEKAGYKEKGTKDVIKSTPVYTGQRVWDDRLGKYVPANASQSYRTRE